jgi:hypothetical protein
MNKKSHGHFIAGHSPGYGNGTNLKSLMDIHGKNYVRWIVNSSRIPFAAAYAPH